MIWPFSLWRKKQFKIQTFTYYIPAPPARKTGYREKEFDKVFYEFINKGFEILNVQTQAHTGVNSCGMWMIFTLRALTPEAEQLDLDTLSTTIETVEQRPADKDQAGLDLPELEEHEEHDQLYYIDSQTGQKIQNS